MAQQLPRPSHMAGSHERQTLFPVPQLDSETKLQFQAVGFVLAGEPARLELPGLGLQPGLVPPFEVPAVTQCMDRWVAALHPDSPQHLLLSPQLLLMERKLQEVHPLLTLCGQIVENWQGNPIQKESLRVFFLVLQVTHYLDAGQVCTASHVTAAGEQAGAGWASD